MPDRTARPPSLCRWAVCVSLASLCSCLWLTAAGHGSELRNSAIVQAVRSARASVVNIRGEKTVLTPAPQSGQAEAARRVNGMGTGIVIDPRGYILTNHHVVDGVPQIQVTTATGEQATARLVARDMETDLAIIKVDMQEELPVITVGKSSDLMPGETVIAVGNAYGYENTVTRGIISALHRAVQVSDAQYYDDLIQTDASINPGNSGGPLLNIDGEMIGINVAVRAGAQGIGFAIPVDKTMSVAANLLASRGLNQTWHGIGLAEDDLPADQGPTVAAVDKDSPAAKTGLHVGDTITAVDQVKVHQPLDFARAMLQRKVGEKVRIEVLRGGKTMRLELTLAEVPEEPKLVRQPTWDLWGLELDPIAPAEFRRKHQTYYHGGLTVTAVSPDGPAAEAGLRRGDVLVGMHIWETVSLENVSYILKRPDITSFSPVKFYILRGEKVFSGYLPVSLTTVQRSILTGGTRGLPNG